jgi:hypothetical protein
MATLIFHQIGLLLLHFAGMTPNMPYDTRPTPPFGVPRVISLAFWGGLWGIVFVLAERYIARSPGGYWIGAIIFGAIFPDVPLHAARPLDREAGAILPVKDRPR